MAENSGGDRDYMSGRPPMRFVRVIVRVIQHESRGLIGKYSKSLRAYDCCKGLFSHVCSAGLILDKILRCG